MTAEQLPPADPGDPLPLDEEAEADRAERVQEAFGDVSEGVVDYTRDLLSPDLWLRPALAPRDRRLVTVSALISAGQTGAFSFHLEKAMDNGLSEADASEVLTQLAFYAGWPNVFAAMPVAKEIFEARAEQLRGALGSPRALAGLPRRPFLRIGPGRAQGAFNA